VTVCMELSSSRQPEGVLRRCHRRTAACGLVTHRNPSLARRHRQASATLAGRRVWSCATFTFADRPWGESLFRRGCAPSAHHWSGVDTGGRDRRVEGARVIVTSGSKADIRCAAGDDLGVCQPALPAVCSVLRPRRCAMTAVRCCSSRRAGVYAVALLLRSVCPAAARWQYPSND
jgi:hypothetical protein